MSFSESEPTSRPFAWRFWAGVIGVVVLFALGLMMVPRKPVLRNVPAPPFVLPEGCDPEDVRSGPGFKPKSPCFVEKYRIKDYEKYNFFRASGSRFYDRQYYRFYDKAVHLVCGSVSEGCQVNHIHSGVFVDQDKVKN
jgi:hypothetical protein